MHATLGQVIMFGFDSDENTDSLSSLCLICPKTKTWFRKSGWNLCGSSTAGVRQVVVGAHYGGAGGVGVPI